MPFFVARAPLRNGMRGALRICAEVVEAMRVGREGWLLKREEMCAVLALPLLMDC